MIIALVIGYVAGGSTNFQLKRASREEIRHQLVKELRQEGFLSPEPESITRVSGTVAGVGENQLTLKSEQRPNDPLNVKKKCRSISTLPSFTPKNK